MDSQGDDPGFVKTTVGRGTGEAGSRLDSLKLGSGRLLARVWEYPGLKNIAIGLTLIWLGVFAIPTIGVQVMYRGQMFLPDSLIYYPISQSYWLKPGSLRGWKGILARVYVWLVLEWGRIMGIAVTVVVAALLGIVLMRVPPEEQR